MFWSGETLLAKLPALITPFREENLDCAAYTLTIGREVYVSPSDETQDPKTKTKRQLGPGEAFTIPPGQFAFLLTEEVVEVPSESLAFISIKAKIKWRGLVNVSGFHVDPGFRGRLIFSVFNAGPAPIHLQQGQPCFLLWYASLDRSSERVKKGPVQENISPEFINSISGELQSLEGLSKKIKGIEKTLGDRINKVEQEHVRLLTIATILLTVLSALVVYSLREAVLSRSSRLTQTAPLTTTSSPPGVPLGGTTSPAGQPPSATPPSQPPENAGAPPRE